MSRLELRGDETNVFEFSLSMIGAEKDISSARLSFMSGDRIVSYPCDYEGDRKEGVLLVKVGTVDESFKSFDNYKLEVFMDDHYFVPLQGKLDIELPVKITSSVRKVEKQPLEMMAESLNGAKKQGRVVIRWKDDEPAIE